MHEGIAVVVNRSLRFCPGCRLQHGTRRSDLYPL